MRREMRAPLLTGLLDWFGYHTRKEIKSIKVLEQILPSCGFSGLADQQKTTGTAKEFPKLIADPDEPGI